MDFQQFGLPAWGSSGPYQKVYEKFGITGSSMFSSDLSAIRSNNALFLDIAVIGKKVVDFYRKRGGEIVSPLIKAFTL
jgi:transketolase